jgi:putative MATE family efflux protein
MSNDSNKNEFRNSNEKAKLIEGPIGKTLIRLTIPMIIGIMGMVIFHLVDTFFIGQLGTEQLAAMGFIFPVIFLISSIAMGIGIGVSSVISRAIGEGDWHKVQRLTTDSLGLSLLIVIGFVSIGILTIEPLFKLLGAAPKILSHIKKYMTIWYPGVIFVIVPMVGNNAIRATGDTKTPAMIMIVAVIANLTLDPLLIFGIGPFPRLELEGAAIATVFARAITLIVAIKILYFRDKMITLVKPNLKQVLNSWKKVLYVGLPNAGTNIIVPFSMGVVTRLVATHGAEAVAALGVGSRIDALALTVIMALGSVLAPFVGQNWGASKHDRVKVAVKYSQGFSLVWGALIFLLFVIFAQPIARLFNDNTDVIAYIVIYLMVVSISYSVFGILILSSAAFNALNKPMPSAFLSLFRMIALYIPLAHLGSHLWQVTGIFLAGCVANLLSGIAAFFWLKRFLSRSATHISPS